MEIGRQKTVCDIDTIVERVSKRAHWSRHLWLVRTRMVQGSKKNNTGWSVRGYYYRSRLLPLAHQEDMYANV